MDPKRFGDYPEEILDDLDSFCISIHSKNVSLRWRQCDLLAAVLADYYAVFFPEDADNAENLVDRKDMTHSINYVINELAENAIKFRSVGDISLSSGLLKNEIVFLISNHILSERVQKFQELLQELTAAEDPGELLVRKMEENALNSNKKVSGLGFLTLMNDYGVKLGWKFQHSMYENNAALHTMARLKIRKG